MALARIHQWRALNLVLSAKTAMHGLRVRSAHE